MKIYAVGLKNWIELRECEGEPTRKETRAAKDLKTRHAAGYDYAADRDIYRSEKVRFRIHSVLFDGGKVIATVPRSKWRIGVPCPPGTCVLVSKASVEKFIKDDWRSKI